MEARTSKHLYAPLGKDHVVNKSLRRTEKWSRRGLWLVALVFASFLIGLGSIVVKDLSKIEALFSPVAPALGQPPPLPPGFSFVDDEELARTPPSSQPPPLPPGFSFDDEPQQQPAPEKKTPMRAGSAIDQLKQTGEHEFSAMKQKPQQTFDNGRYVLLPDKPAAPALPKLPPGFEYVPNEPTAPVPQVARKLAEEKRARGRDEEARVLRVFLFRLALTLPLLLVALWLFRNKRKSVYWPFVWGFIFFALFTFFVELVPYLPYYGGYVRYVVGIALTALLGRYAILALHRYLERQKQSEALPEQERRKGLSYDMALALLTQAVCPACERPVDLKNEALDFCPHCGMGLSNHCGHCNARKSSFSRFCHTCGTAAVEPTPAG